MGALGEDLPGSCKRCIHMRAHNHDSTAGNAAKLVQQEVLPRWCIQGTLGAKCAKNPKCRSQVPQRSNLALHSECNASRRHVYGGCQTFTSS